MPFRAEGGAKRVFALGGNTEKEGNKVTLNHVVTPKSLHISVKIIPIMII